MNVGDIPKAIETLMSQTMLQISQAASKANYDVAELEALTKRATELKQMKAQVAAIQHKLHSMSGNFEPKANECSHGSFYRELLVKISQGMINQNLITLTDSIKRGLVMIGEELIIEALPSGDKFKTVVIQPGNKLQERGAIGKFYRDAKIHGEDYVVLREVARGQWQLLKSEKIHAKKPLMAD